GRSESPGGPGRAERPAVLAAVRAAGGADPPGPGAGPASTGCRTGRPSRRTARNSPCAPLARGSARIGTSVDAAAADRLKACTEQAGMGVAAYMASAAIRQMDETGAAEKGFRAVDALIAGAEAARRGPIGEGEAPLTEEERREVDEAMRLVYGDGERNASGRGEVAGAPAPRSTTPGC